MDPFACYFRNVQLTDHGEYETKSRDECRNDACRICDTFFSDMNQGDEDVKKDVVLELDDVLLDIVTQVVSNSYEESKETRVVVPSLAKNDGYNSSHY